MSTDITTTLKFPFSRSGISSDFIVTSDAFPASVDVAEAGKLQVRLIHNSLPKGDYQILISGRFTIDNLLNIPIGRYSKDGGTTWYDFALESSSVTEGNLFATNLYLMKYSGVDLDCVIQLRKGLATDVMTVTACDVSVQRVS